MSNPPWKFVSKLTQITLIKKKVSIISKQQTHNGQDFSKATFKIYMDTVMHWGSPTVQELDYLPWHTKPSDFILGHKTKILFWDTKLKFWWRSIQVFHTLVSHLIGVLPFFFFLFFFLHWQFRSLRKASKQNRRNQTRLKLYIPRYTDGFHILTAITRKSQTWQ